ncbi:hypothetical protein DXG01_011435, partial [Tephrocybe rancida]
MARAGHRQQTNLVADKLVLACFTPTTTIVSSPTHCPASSPVPRAACRRNTSPHLRTTLSRIRSAREVQKGRPQVGESPEHPAKDQGPPRQHSARPKRCGQRVTALSNANGQLKRPNTGAPGATSNTRRRPRTNERTTMMRASADACPTNPAQQHKHHAEQCGYPHHDTRVLQQHQVPPEQRATCGEHGRPPTATSAPRHDDDAPPPTARRPHTTT